MKKPKLKLLEELPEFEKYPFDGKTNVPVYEVARITFRQQQVRQSSPYFSCQLILGVVGINKFHNTIYASKCDFVLADTSSNSGLLLANNDFIEYKPKNCLNIDNIEKYEILIPHSELIKPLQSRRI